MRLYIITDAILNMFRARYDGAGFPCTYDIAGNNVVPVSYSDADRFNMNAELANCEIVEREIIN